MTGRDKGRFQTCSSAANTWEAATTRSACTRKASSFRCSPKPVPSLLLCECHSVQVANGVVFPVGTRHSLERVTSFESSPHVGGIPRKYFFFAVVLVPSYAESHCAWNRTLVEVFDGEHPKVVDVFA